MRRALLLSLRHHGLWLLQAFGGRGRALTGLGPRRLAILLLFFPCYILVQALHWLGFLLDEVMYPEWRATEVKEPLFITGIPRSGGTRIYRTLARDTEQFTCLRLWEALLAPSITERRLLQALARLDRRMGRPVRNCLERIFSRCTRGLPGVGRTGLAAPAEDYLCLLPATGCFLLVLALPASPSLWQLGRFQEIPDDERAALLAFYKACLQKHLYRAGAGRRLLSKNSAFGSWIPDLRRTFPDARYLVCLREPRAALNAQLGSIRTGLEFFATLPAADTYALELQTVSAHAFRIIAEERKSFLVDHLAIVDHAQLDEAAVPLLKGVVKRLTLRLTTPLENAIEAEFAAPPAGGPAPAPVSTRSGPREYDAMIRAVYEDILREPHLRQAKS